MPSTFTHAIVSVAIGKVSFLEKPGTKFWLLAMFCAVIPDIDAIGFWYGVDYYSFWGHRGFTHSIVFSFLLATLVMFLFYRAEQIFAKKWLVLWFVFFFSTVSHPLLDAMTSGGLGVALYLPFDSTRYFFRFRPIRVSPIGITSFFSSWGARVIVSEFFWVWIPSSILIVASYGIKKLFAR